MTREIKFRGKRVDGGGWVYGYLYQYEDASFILASETPFRKGYSIITYPEIRIEPAYAVVPETVGQFVGIKDNSLKEVYKGDIFEIACYDETNSWFNSKMGEVYKKHKLKYYIGKIEKFDNRLEFYSVIYAEKYDGSLLSCGDLEKGQKGEWNEMVDMLLLCYVTSVKILRVIGNEWDNPELLKGENK